MVNQKMDCICVGGVFAYYTIMSPMLLLFFVFGTLPLLLRLLLLVFYGLVVSHADEQLLGEQPQK